MVERIDIERALDDLASDEAGFKFQGLAVVLAKLRWPELVACERHKDFGLDAYASSTISPDGRGKGLACSTTAAFKKVNGDAVEAQKHYSDISLFVFYTTQRISQPMKAEWATKIREACGYELVVMSREEIIAALQLPDNAGICRTHLKIPVPYQPPLAELLSHTREAAAEIAGAWAAHPRLAGRPQIELNVVALDDRGGETRDVFDASYLRTLLVQSRRIVLEGPAGCGKTTTLIQMTRLNGFQGIPVLVDLPGWVKSGLDILEYLARRPEFCSRGIDPAALSRLQPEQPYLFMLNGWNEISQIHSEDGISALRDLARTFPKAGIIVATRTNHLTPPLMGASRFRLLPLSADQRHEYLLLAMGADQANALDSQLASDAVLNALTRIPLILSEVTTIFRSGQEIPGTKLGLLAKVIDLMERSEEHRSQLEILPLRGRADTYLASLAIHLTARGDVTLNDVEACKICQSVGQQLRNNGQVAAPPEPSDVLNALCAHHVLERLDYPNVNYRFEHQQFQEYYSALALQRILTEITTSGTGNARHAFTQTYINNPAWEEPLCMIAAHAALGGNEAIGSFLVSEALRVDVVFAARLAHLAGPLVWKRVGHGLNQQLRSLYARSNPYIRKCALAAMVASGSDEFADILFSLLTCPDQQVRLGTYRLGIEFHLSSLGPNWQLIVADWPEQLRIEFVTELSIYQGRADVALVFAQNDASERVRLEALRALAWRGKGVAMAQLLAKMPDSDLAAVIRRLDVEEMPPPLRSRAASIHRLALAETQEPKARFHLAMVLASLGDPETPARVKQELRALPAPVVKELGQHQLQPAIEIVRRTDPAWVSEWVAERIIEGTLWHEPWIRFVAGIPDELARTLLRRTAEEDLRTTASAGAISVLAATTDAMLAKEIFEAVRNQHRKLKFQPVDQREVAIDSQLQGLLRLVSPPVLIEGLNDMLAQTPQGDDLTVVIELFRGTGVAGEPDVRNLLPEAPRQRVRHYLKSAVPVVLAQEDFCGEVKGYLATALAEVGEPEDIGDLTALIQADIARVKEGREAKASGERSERAQRSSMCWSGWHVQALVRVGHIQSEQVLLNLLSEPEYEVDAAWGLQALAKIEKPDRHAVRAGRFGPSSRDYKKIRNALRETLAAFNESRRTRYAAAVRERIGVVMEESQGAGQNVLPFYHRRLKELGKVLGALDAANSGNLLLQIAALPGRSDGWHGLDLVEPLIFAGVPVLLDAFKEIFNPVIAEFRRHGLYNDNANLLVRILCMLPFIEPCTAAIAYLNELSQEFRLPLYDKRGLLTALSRSRCEEGFLMLRSFARPDDPAFQNIAKDWFQTMVESSHPAARLVLMSGVDPSIPDGIGDMGFPDHDLGFIAGSIARFAQDDPVILNRLIQLADQPLSGQRRVILAKVLAWIDSPEALIAGLNLIDDSAQPPLPFELWKATEDLILEKRPYKDNPQSYTRVPRAAAHVRRRLFEMATHDSRRTRTAMDLLGQIEEWRLEYGRPTSEPRHPMFESGEAWPLSPKQQP